MKTFEQFHFVFSVFYSFLNDYQKSETMVCTVMRDPGRCYNETKDKF